ncbi:hypothetical protein [Streptomyces sp. NRRL S-1022]|uniref:hypothetical protein n=1 Tax=Streptomyces sp. NRRL S-1022 TaxID=1463880 RepID=UPI00068B4875|nr:hypothetical protein [Streptomyces sp. NRRL S-1022]
MGVSRRIRRGARAAAVVGFVGVGAGAVTACQPGGLGSATVAYTTDRTATAALEHRHVDVAWLTCTGRQGDDRTHGTSPAPSESTVVSVDCRGETHDGRKIVVTGLVTRAVDGACVRGDLTAEVGGRQVFHADGLGNCAATPGPTYRPPTGGQPKPDVTVTVTVTRTVWPVQGK